MTREHTPILPALLIGIGAAALLDSGAPIWLAIGIYFLSRGLRSDHYPLLIAGAFVTGSAAGHLVGDIVGGLGDPLGAFGTAAGFAWLFSTDRPRSGWAVVGAVIFGLIGLAQLGARVGDVASAAGGGWLLPAGVVVSGILLLGAHRMPGPLRLAGLVFVAAAALSLLANVGDREGPRRERRTSPTPTSALAMKTFDVDDREVWIDGEDNPIIVREGTGSVVGASLDITGERVTINADGDEPVTVEVPRGTHLNIEIDDGPISVLVPTADVIAETGDGPIVLQQVTGDPTIEAECDNAFIIVDGKNEEASYAYAGTSGRIEARTDDGPITITHAPEPVGAGQR